MILIDSHALVWLALDDARLSEEAATAIRDPDTQMFVSAVTAYEFADLNCRGRFGADLPLDDLLALLHATVLDFPADCWRIAAALPPIHRDPIDRMLIAHAMHADLTLVTADRTMRDYPVRTLW